MLSKKNAEIKRCAEILSIIYTQVPARASIRHFRNKAGFAPCKIEKEIVRKVDVSWQYVSCVNYT